MSRTLDVTQPGAALEDGPLGGAAEPVVRFEGVGMRYGRSPEVLQDVSFELQPGSFHFLTGPSGAGKSSLLKLIYLAHRPSRGRVSLFGRDVLGIQRRELPALRRRIGVVFQEYRLLDHVSVFDNAALPLRLAGAKPSAYQSDVAELLTWVGLGRRFSSISSLRMRMPISRSRLPVGSSASSRSGRATTARAIASRCFSPPARAGGRWVNRRPSPTQVRSSATSLW